MSAPFVQLPQLACLACRFPLAGAVWSCPACAAQVHPDCADEFRGCPGLGCGGSSPLPARFDHLLALLAEHRQLRTLHQLHAQIGEVGHLDDSIKVATIGLQLIHIWMQQLRARLRAGFRLRPVPASGDPSRRVPAPQASLTALKPDPDVPVRRPSLLVTAAVFTGLAVACIVLFYLAVRTPTDRFDAWWLLRATPVIALCGTALVHPGRWLPWRTASVAAWSATVLFVARDELRAHAAAAGADLTRLEALCADRAVPLRGARRVS